MIISYEGLAPEIDGGSFVAENATVAGDVRMGSGSSIWFGAVVRGDVASVTIGERTNVQDLSVLHVEKGCDLVVGDDVTIGHRAVVHGCTVRDRVLIGMGSIIMNGAEVGEDSIIGAGSVVTEGAIIPPRSLVVGVPGKVKRELEEEEVLSIAHSSQLYTELAAKYKRLSP